MASGEVTTVLVVEDEPPLVEIYARWLEDSYEVLTAESGEEALAVIDGTVDIVLLDRLMPGLSGDEVLKRVREQEYGCQVAMVTAVEPDFDIIQMGFDDYLVKPVSRETLVDTVERLLSRHEFADLERRYYSLVAKRSTLQETKSQQELETHDEYAELQEEIAAVQERLEETMEIGDDEFVAMVRDIDDARDQDPDDV